MQAQLHPNRRQIRSNQSEHCNAPAKIRESSFEGITILIPDYLKKILPKMKKIPQHITSNHPTPWDGRQDYQIAYSH